MNQTPAPPTDDGHWGVLLGVWLVALSLRCLYLWQIHPAPFFDLRIGDAEAYHLWARRIAAGDWLGQDAFYQAPLYPYFLAGIYRVVGDSIVTVRAVQACIGAGSCALLAGAGLSLFGRGGAIAGLGLAVYPSAIFLDGLVEKSSLVIFFTTALLALLATPRDRMTATRWFGTGVVLGLLALTRENALLLIAPVLLWIAVGAASPAPGSGSRSPGSGVREQTNKRKSALVFVAGCALILLPVALRNAAVAEEVHLTTSQFGPNFYIGNHAGAKGSYEPLVAGHGSAADEREDATRLAEQVSGRKLSSGEVSSFWTNQSLDYIRSQPVAWLKLMARKAALTFNAAEVVDTESQDVYAEWSSLLRLLEPFNFGVLFALAAFGTALTARSWRRLWFLYAIAGTYALSVVLFYVVARYRFPLVPVLMILSAGGLIEAVAQVRRPEPRKLGVGIVVAALAAALALLPLENVREARATYYLDIASTLSKDPARRELAMDFYTRALHEAPDFPGVHFGLGTLLARMGRPAEAIPHYRATLESWPAHVEARYNLGQALAAAGQAQEASRQFEEALGIRPDDADVHVALAAVLVSLNRPGDAVSHYQRGLVLQPKNVTALVGFGVALTQVGRPDEAIEQYRLALQLDPQDADAHNNLGYTLASEGRLAEAVPHFERALELKPGDENARKNLERVRQTLKRR